MTFMFGLHCSLSHIECFSLKCVSVISDFELGMDNQLCRREMVRWLLASMALAWRQFDVKSRRRFQKIEDLVTQGQRVILMELIASARP